MNNYVDLDLGRVIRLIGYNPHQCIRAEDLACSRRSESGARREVKVRIFLLTPLRAVRTI